MARFAAAALAYALGIPVVAACGGSDDPSTFRTEGRRAAAGVASGTYFDVPDRWHALTAALDTRAEEIPVAWASNVAFDEADVARREMDGFPTATVQALARNGIVIVAVGPHRSAASADFPQMTAPLAIADGPFLEDGYEGQPAPHVSFGFIDVRVGADVLNVLYYFGRNEPTSDMREEANRVLAGLHVVGRS